MSSPRPEPEVSASEQSSDQSSHHESLNDIPLEPIPGASVSTEKKDEEHPQFSRKNLDVHANNTNDTNLEASLMSIGSDNEERRLSAPWQRHVSRSPAPRKIFKGWWDAFWLRNKGVALVVLSQFFGAAMSAATRLLETSGNREVGMHPLQIVFARMSITSILCFLYMWYQSVPYSPFGQREVRSLLVARGIGGFFGIFGLYYSLLYLPIAEATVMTFLAPIVACFACSLLIDEPFTRMEQITGLISLCGVVLIARPTSFFTSSSTTMTSVGTANIPSNATSSSIEANMIRKVTSIQRLSAVGMAILGVLGAACAYTTIRWIGKRAHPLISVNYFAVWCTIVSTIGLLIIPNIGFQLPADLKEWLLLIFLGICGFIGQFLLTAGLQHEKSSRATNMIYTVMLFALGFDKIIWGTGPGAVSIIGSSLILGSAIYVAIQKEVGKKMGSTTSADEGRSLVAGAEYEDNDYDDYDARGGGELRHVHDVQLRATRV